MILLWTHVLETVCECATSSVSRLLEVAHSALLIGCRGQEKLIQFVEAHTVSHRREGVEMAYALLKICKWEVTVFNVMGCSQVFSCGNCNWPSWITQRQTCSDRRSMTKMSSLAAWCKQPNFSQVCTKYNGEKRKNILPT